VLCLPAQLIILDLILLFLSWLYSLP
jgi:hypothetical protein